MILGENPSAYLLVLLKHNSQTIRLLSAAEISKLNTVLKNLLAVYNILITSHCEISFQVADEIHAEAEHVGHCNVIELVDAIIVIYSIGSGAIEQRNGRSPNGLHHSGDTSNDDRGADSVAEDGEMELSHKYTPLPSDDDQDGFGGYESPDPDFEPFEIFEPTTWAVLKSWWLMVCRFFSLAQRFAS